MTDANPSGASADENFEDEFTWGEPDQEGSSNSKRQRYYKSFWYSGEQFLLYDYVYLNSGDDDAPFIGKIMRLWEIPEKKLKKIRVRWLYRPSDIPEEITDVDRSPSNKEVFLSFGGKDGVENVNDLEVVSGRCKIFCIAVDKRNKQPSESELADAHHVFSRSFNVDEQELYPNLDKVVEELGARKVFNYAWASEPRDNESLGSVKSKGATKVEQENVNSKGKKKVQKKAPESEGRPPQVFDKEDPRPASTSENREDVDEKNNIVERDVAGSTGAVLPGKDMNGRSPLEDAPESRNDSKQVKRHLDDVSDVQRKKSKVQNEKPKDHESDKKSTVSKAPKNLEKSASSGNLDAKNNSSKNLQITNLKKELQLPGKEVDAVPSKKLKTEDQKSGDKGKLGKLTDDTDSKKTTLSNISSKKTDTVASGPEGGKVTSSSPRPNMVAPASVSKGGGQRMVEKKKPIPSVAATKVDAVVSGTEGDKVTASSAPATDSNEEQKVGDAKTKSLGGVAAKKVSIVASQPEVGKVKALSPKQLAVVSTIDPKDNSKPSLSKTLSKKGVESSIEGGESGVPRKIKADDHKKTDESSLSKDFGLQSSSKNLISGVKANKANGLYQKTADKVPPTRSLETSVFKKPKAVDQMSGAVAQSPRPSDNNFRSLLDRDSAKTMMLGAASKPSESKASVATEQRRRIFREPTPEEKLERGFRNGKVIHLKNFDVSLTKEDLEEALKTLIPRCELVMFSQKDLPHIFPSCRGYTVLDSGQALLVFTDKSQGDAALSLLQDSCVVLTDDGRPLLATEVEQRAPGKNKFIGHLNLDKFRILRNLESEGMRNAVATSHCSQPNTIEYEMAVQWRVIDEQEQIQWEQLQKKQEEAVKLLLRKHT